MTTILDQFEIIEETDDHITYMDGDTLVIESIEDSPLMLNETPEQYESAIDPENPQLIAFRSILFDTIYHQLDIREWVV